MNKILYAVLVAAVGFGTANAQQKMMKIEYKDGTEELRNVSEVSKITFINEGQVDPSTKMVDLGLSVNGLHTTSAPPTPGKQATSTLTAKSSLRASTLSRPTNGTTTGKAKTTTNGKTT